MEIKTMQASIPMKYRRPNSDWEKLPFQANGAGIAVYASVVAALASNSSSQIGQFAIVPSIVYLAGLLAAYRVHVANMLLVGDVEMRERLNDAMEWLSEVEARGVPNELKEQMEALPLFVIQQRAGLLTNTQIQNHQLRAAKAYALSLALFLAGTTLVLAYLWVFLVSRV